MNTTPHGSPRPANRLAAESSPYLLQHAHNPVDWWPWGEAAFAEARRRNVPILLSIGYSTCHWCHVMERECFDNEAIAALLNASFVCIKVDREERPAVDDAYMAATMMLSGHGGWPMTVFLEPTTLAPFWAGTYFPPEPRPEYGNRPSLPQVVEALIAAWRDRRAEVLSQADQVAKAVREHLGTVAPQAQLGQNTVADAVSQILQQFDRVHGGFGAAPKFPQPVYIDLLAAVRARAADDSTADALDIAVRNSLNAMAVGGIFDQIGGGFHRYSVDASWTIPHFEKMLYDQALLAPQYARAARAFGDPYFEEIARRTLGFVRSTLKGPHGAFLSALDADTNGREGLTYTWTAEEFRTILGDDADHALRFYGLSGPPNFKDPHHPADPAVHLPRLAARPEHLAPGLQMGPAEFSILRHTVNDRLLAARSTRPQPFLDDKVIASWNGLAIAAFAECGMELEDASLIAEASAAADAALSLLRGPDGSLARTWRNGTRSGDPALEDYAAMMKGLLAIAAADAGQRHARTEQALRLFAHAKEHYHDSSGAWFDAPDRAKELFVRPRSTHDGAVPCGCSMMLHNLIDLHELSGAREPLDLALKGIGSISGALAAAPAGASNGVRALFRLLLLKEVPPGEAPPPAPSRQAPLARSTVEVYAGVERMSLAPDTPAKTSILVRIAPGTHLAAADAGESAQQPFRIDVIGGSGVAVYADYPPGKPFEVGGHPMRIYEGEFELPIVLEREGEWKGRPLLCLRFQACTSTECLPPMIYELDIALDAVG